MLINYFKNDVTTCMSSLVTNLNSSTVKEIVSWDHDCRRVRVHTADATQIVGCVYWA